MFVQSLGCRASQADGAAIEASLEARGYIAVSDAARADLVVLNTCTVTQAADVDARRIVRGCIATTLRRRSWLPAAMRSALRKNWREIAGVRWVVGNSHKTEIAELGFAGTGRLSRPECW